MSPTPLVGNVPQTQKPKVSSANALAVSGLVVFVAGVALGYGASRLSAGMPIFSTSDSKGGYDQGYAAARKKLADSGLFLPMPISSPLLVGKVAEVGTGVLVLEVNLTGPNPLEQLPGPARRTVRVTTDTQVLRYTYKTPSEMEQEARNRTTNAAQPSPHAVEPYKTEPFTLSEIKIGDTIQTIADHNVLNEAEFTAKEIHVYR